MEALTGSTPDISMIYRFKFWDLVYIKRDESKEGKLFPYHSNETMGRFVGFSESVGHLMTYNVITMDTQRLLYRSRVKMVDVDRNFLLEGIP